MESLYYINYNSWAGNITMKVMRIDQEISYILMVEDIIGNLKHLEDVMLMSKIFNTLLYIKNNIWIIKYDLL